MAAKTHALITQLYVSFGRKLLSMILKRNGGDLAAAEDIIQEAFTAAYASYGTFKNKSTYFTWLYRITMNKMSDYYRSQIRHKSKIVVPTLEQFASIVDPGLSPEEELSLNELKSKVAGCLNLLPAEYKKLLELKYYSELSNTQISLRLDLSPRKLEGRLYRAKKALAEIYEKHSSSN